MMLRWLADDSVFKEASLYCKNWFLHRLAGSMQPFENTDTVGSCWYLKMEASTILLKMSCPDVVCILGKVCK